MLVSTIKLWQFYWQVCPASAPHELQHPFLLVLGTSPAAAPLPLRPPRHPAAPSDKLSASYVGTGRLTCSLAVVLLAQANSASRLEAKLCQYCAALIST